MTTKQLLVDKSCLVLLIEARKDSLGKTCYVVTCSLGRFRFREMSSVLDFMDMNKDLGYVE